MPRRAGVPPRINPCVRATYADAMADLDFDAFALVPKGHAFEDFHDGQVFEHHGGRTLNDGDNSLFRNRRSARRIGRLLFEQRRIRKLYVNSAGWPGSPTACPT